MDILVILSCVAVGMVIGMTFEAIYNMETRKFDHARIVALNGEIQRLKKNLHKVKKELTTQPVVNKTVIELLDFSDPYQDIKFGD